MLLMIESLKLQLEVDFENDRSIYILSMVEVENVRYNCKKLPFYNIF